MNKHDGWLKAAGDACSFMRMYALALEISTDAADKGLRRSAHDVVSILEGVIDRPIADSRRLKEARRRFTVLLAHLADQEEPSRSQQAGGFVLRMSMMPR